MSIKKLHPNGYFLQRATEILEIEKVPKNDFAESLGITASYVSMLLSGKKKEPSETLNRLLDFVYPLEKNLKHCQEMPPKLMAIGMLIDDFSNDEFKMLTDSVSAIRGKRKTKYQDEGNPQPLPKQANG
jgi:transcriptional regulator with XRE-family HTH domain